MKKTVIFCILLIFVSCKYDRDKLEDKKSTFSDKDSLLITNANEFNQTNFKDRAEELIYIREYLKYKLPLILIKKLPEEMKKVQYELISQGENPSLEEAAKRSLYFYNEFESNIWRTISGNISFKTVKSDMEKYGKVTFRFINIYSILYTDDERSQLKEDERMTNIDEQILINKREILYKSEPKYTCDEEGKVIVEITIDRFGNAINAVAGIKGTTNNAKCLLDEAKAAAMKTKWEPNENIDELEIKKLVYVFNM